MTTTERWERRLGIRQNMPDVTISWDVDPNRTGVSVADTGSPGELREMSVSGAAIVAPFAPEFVEGADVSVAHGSASGLVRIRRVEQIGDDMRRLYAVEFIDPDPALANSLYPFLDSPTTGELEAAWHGRYVD
jgi:hypothetical protein